MLSIWEMRKGRGRRTVYRKTANTAARVVRRRRLCIRTIWLFSRQAASQPVRHSRKTIDPAPESHNTGADLRRE